MSTTTHISTSGGLLSTAFIENIRQARTNQRGTQPDTFALPWAAAPTSPAGLEAKIAETWEALLERWDAIARDLPQMDLSQARERWLLPLFRALDFYPVYQRSDIVLGDSEALRFNVSHFGWPASQPGDSLVDPDAPPLHTVAPAAGLDARPAGAAAGRSAKGKSPHDMLQLFLNISRKHRWGVLTDGLHLRLLRDFHHTYTKGYVEFDLESIFETRNFADFRAMYRLAHASRFVGAKQTLEQTAEQTAEVRFAESSAVSDTLPLEMFYRDSQAAGIQVGADLREQVRLAIETLGNGFLMSGSGFGYLSSAEDTKPAAQTTPPTSLLEALQTNPNLCQQFYSELLHIVYRLLFLLYAEQRGLTPRSGAPLENLYRQSYSLTALRAKAESDPASPEAYDLWEGLKVTFKLLQKGADELGIFAYNGMLFAPDQTPLLDGQRDAAPLRCRNYELLRAIRALTLIEREGVLQRISYADLNVEEIGGIYESLLDFAPRVTTGAEHVEGRDLPPHTFFLDPRGTARKTSGSYYTHPSLVNALIESALLPVLEAKLAEVNSQAESLTYPEAAATAILSLKICDPAMGSGHFLIAANNALALRLAQIRTGDDYPAERDLRRARRDVLAHCLYGVDLNPMAVELAKVSLWINAAVDDAPLSFLDHHLKCGNSLIGATPDLLKAGVPDAAFEPVSGDDPKVAAAVRKRNKKEREGQLSLWRVTVLRNLGDNAKYWAELTQLAEDSPRLAESRYHAYRADPAYCAAKLAADLWTVAFFWPLQAAEVMPTEELFRQAQADPDLLPAALVKQVDELAQHYRFFHWHLEFPDVFGEDQSNGFDIVLGNPPWERVRFEEKQLFSVYDPQITKSNKSARQKIIKGLLKSNAFLAEEFENAKYIAEATSKFIRIGGRFPLTATGDVNTYAIFAELGRDLLNGFGRVGLILPTGIATDSPTKNFFADLIETQTLSQLIGFENEAFIFPEVHNEFKFCAMIMTGRRVIVEQVDFVFFCRYFEHMNQDERHFLLTRNDLLLLNPNTRTCPVFRTKTDAELTKHIYRNSKILVNEETGENSWGIYFSRIFDMNKVEILDLCVKSQTSPSEHHIPMYEAKMIWQYDHRFASFFDDRNPGSRPSRKFKGWYGPNRVDLYEFIIPRYWISRNDVISRINQWPKNWLVGYRDITNATNERTCIMSILPFSGADFTIRIATFNQSVLKICCFVGNFNCIPFDYIARQNVAGTHLSDYITKQLPILPPDRYTSKDLMFIVPRVLELVYTAWDIVSFADEVWKEADESLRIAIKNQWKINQDFIENKDNSGEKRTKEQQNREGIPYMPFNWEENRRAILRSELDAYYALLYGLTYDELRYILDPVDIHGLDFPGATFRVLKEKETKLYGEYRTRRLVLEAWERLQAK